MEEITERDTIYPRYIPTLCDIFLNWLKRSREGNTNVEIIIKNDAIVRNIYQSGVVQKMVAI